MAETGRSPGAGPNAVSTNAPSETTSIGRDPGGPPVVESTTATITAKFPISELHGTNGPTQPAQRASSERHVRRTIWVAYGMLVERRCDPLPWMRDGSRVRVETPVRLTLRPAPTSPERSRELAPDPNRTSDHISLIERFVILVVERSELEKPNA